MELKDVATTEVNKTDTAEVVMNIASTEVIKTKTAEVVVYIASKEEESKVANSTEVNKTETAEVVVIIASMEEVMKIDTAEVVIDSYFKEPAENQVAKTISEVEAGPSNLKRLKILLDPMEGEGDIQ